MAKKRAKPNLRPFDRKGPEEETKEGEAYRKDLGDLAEALEDLPEAVWSGGSAGFLESIRDSVEDMTKRYDESQRFTEGQREAVRNWAEAVENIGRRNS